MGGWVGEQVETKPVAVPKAKPEKAGPTERPGEIVGRPPEAAPHRASSNHDHHLIPCSMATAAELCDRFHRHNGGLPLGVFAIGLSCEGEVIGAVIVGMPATKSLMDGYTAEIRRVVVIGEHKNANSMLYGAAWRAAQALGYKRLFTYTLETESGSSPKAIGMKIDRVFTNDSAESWDFYRELKGSADPIRSPPRDVPKFRWVITTEDWEAVAAKGRLVYPEGMMSVELESRSEIGSMQGDW